MSDTNWWDSHDNIVTLTAWMADQHWSAHDIAHAVEKPWKFTDEWLEARAQLVADGVLDPEAP